MAKQFIMPGKIYSGNEALKMAEENFSSLGKKALIVTDLVMIKLGNVKKVEDALKNQGITYVIFSEITGEPSDKMIEAGLHAYTQNGCDFLIALGGGSPIDAMKAIGALVTNKGSICDYAWKEIKIPTPPLVAIPTTAGTGSEATQFTIITDTNKNIKMLIKGTVLMPDIAIIDPQFTITAPSKITAATGVDALTHAIEAYTSRKAQQLSDNFAVSATKRIFKYLPIAFDEGNNIEAREQMAIAALEAGIAFNNSSVTIVHGMSRPIGALFHVPHGISNAMLLKECLFFALEGTYERFARLGYEIGVADEKDDVRVAARKFLAAVKGLCDKLQIPSVEAYGIDPKQFFAAIDQMADDAIASKSPQNTIKEVSKQDIVKIYQKLWD